MSEQQASQTLQAYSIFHSEKGKLVLTDLAKECGLFSGSPSLDAMQLAAREGQRQMLHKLLTLSNMSMESLHTLFINDYRNTLEGEK